MHHKPEEVVLENVIETTSYSGFRRSSHFQLHLLVRPSFIELHLSVLVCKIQRPLNLFGKSVHSMTMHMVQCHVLVVTTTNCSPIPSASEHKTTRHVSWMIGT